MTQLEKLRPQLESWICTRLGLAAGSLTDVRSASNGFSAETVFATLAAPGGETSDIVVRLEQHGPEIFLDTSIQRQAQVMQALEAAGIPAPVVIDVEPDQAILGQAFIAMERKPGRTFPQTPNYLVGGWVKALHPEHRRDLWSDIFTLLGRLNKLCPADGFEFLDRPRYGTPGLDQHLGWLEAWRADTPGALNHPIIASAFRQLHQTRPAPLPVNFLWGDANPCNMLFKGLTISAVLDFEAASLGPAEADLGWWLFLDRTRIGANSLLPGTPSREECIDIYERALGRPTCSVDYFEIMGGLRMTMVIVRTVDRLIASGLLAPNTDAAIANPIVGTLAQLLGEPAPAVGQGFADFITAVTQSKA